MSGQTRPSGGGPVKIAAGLPMVSGMNTAVVRSAPYPVRAASKRCAKCGKAVARSAFACRRCGKRQRIRPKTILLVLSGCLVAGLFAATGAGLAFAPPRPPEYTLSSREQSVVKTIGAVPSAAGATEIGAADLWLAYVRDARAADRLFKDKSLVVRGTVRSVGRDFDGGMLVRLSTGDSLETVNARLALRNDPGMHARKGTQVSLLCMGRGVLIGAPTLGNCFLNPS
jgi:hypothetical protein